MAGKQDKAAAKEAARARRSAFWKRIGQVFEAFKIQRREDRGLVPWMAGVFLAAVIVVFGGGLLFGVRDLSLIPLGVFAVLLGVLLAVIVFGRRVQRNVFGKADGQPGAAAWALDNLRGQWKVTPAVSGNAQLDAVHRVLGRPGVILVGEGAPQRVKSLLSQEKKRVARVVGSTPIYEIIVGNDEDQVSLRKLQAHLTKLPRNISAKQVDSLENRLQALGSRAMAMPKGPIPQNAKMRSVQRAARRR